jgi:hypothetical protein
MLEHRFLENKLLHASSTITGCANDTRPYTSFTWIYRSGTDDLFDGLDTFNLRDFGWPGSL